MEELVMHKGRPLTREYREPREMAVYDFLDSLGIEYERVDHESAFTMEECRRVDDFLAPAVVCKNLFLTDRKKERFFLCLLKDGKKFVTKEICSQIGVRLSFASAENMEKYLGLLPGSVSLMGLMNDTGNRVELLVDEDVFDSELFGCHPCMNTSSIRMKTSDAFGVFLPATHHSLRKVKIETFEE